MRKISRTVRRIQVLIETYWNVNEYPQDVVNAGRLSINRNILECKYESIKLIHNRFLVLIETYWNVNQIIIGLRFFKVWY